MRITAKKFGFATLIFVTLLSYFFHKTNITYSATDHVVISEIQISAEGNTNGDFIELYNPTNNDVNLSGYRLVKRTSSGTTNTGMVAFTADDTIPSRGFFLWCHTSLSEQYVCDRSTSSTIANNNSVALLYGSVSDGEVVDAITIGIVENSLGEGVALATPEAGTSMERKANAGSTSASMGPGGADEVAGNGYDTNSNENDFVLRAISQPQNSSSPVEPPDTTVTPTINTTPTVALTPSPTPTTTPTPSEATVVINEIAWSGTKANSNHEWMELYNTTGVNIDLTGWTLSAVDGTPSITLTGSIPAYGYFLLERSTDDTVGDIAADQIYTGALGDAGESLELKNSTGQIIDTANGNGGGWPAGSSSEKKSMERINPLLPDTDDNWGTNDGVVINGLDANTEPILGTPKAQNSLYIGSLTPTPTQTVAPTSSITPTITPSPTLTPTLSITPSPVPTTSPTPQPPTEPIVIGSFSLPGRTLTCTLHFQIRTYPFGYFWLPRISCTHIK
jgi:hypothetical protein